jgi:cytochrome bd ubiquinol oxidase subunit I
VTPYFARTAKPLYLDMARFWTRVFGLIFAIGVVTGIPMEFQFGTNWARYARFIGDVACRGERCSRHQRPRQAHH